MFRCFLHCVCTAILDKITSFAVLNPSDWNFKFNDTAGTGKFLLNVPLVCCFWEKGIGTKALLMIRC